MDSLVSSGHAQGSRAYGGASMRSVMLPNIGRMSKNSSVVSTGSMYRNRDKTLMPSASAAMLGLSSVVSGHGRDGMGDVGLKSSSLNDVPVGLKASSFDMKTPSSFDIPVHSKRYNA
jgi:hypothetical protein